MPNHMKFCGCRSCRSGMHRHRNGKSAVVRRAARKLRRRTKVSLRNGEEPPRVVSVPYTD